MVASQLMCRTVRQRSQTTRTVKRCRTVLIGLILASPVASAGQGPATLPVGGTISFNLFRAGLPQRADGWQPSAYIGNRFGGRLAVPVGGGFALGLSVTSWEADDVSATACAGRRACEHWLVFRGEAFATVAFAQRHFGRRLFLRAGAGPVRSDSYRTDEPGDTFATGLIRAERRERFGLTLGAGVDVAVAEHIFVTPSVDAYRLVAVGDTDRELKSAVVVGVGLTIR